MAHDPEFERKHPRDPADGQFVETPGSAWAARISDSIGGGRPAAHNPPAIQSVTELKQFPQVSPDGRPVSLKALSQYGRMEDDGESPSFDGLEFWDEHNGTWRDGGLAFMETGDDGQLELHIDDPDEGGLGGLTIRGGVTVRNAIEPTVHHTPGVDPPDPKLEYLHLGANMYVHGNAIEVIKSPYHEGYDWEAYDSTFEPDPDGSILGRLAIYPTNFDTRPLDPDHPDARQVRALDLLEKPNRAYLLGGYQILGPDGQWHTIEEAYQDDPDQEVMELIADGLHLPELDTSEELIIRRTPWGQ